jgi:hypothetical protein
MRGKDTLRPIPQVERVGSVDQIGENRDGVVVALHPQGVAGPGGADAEADPHTGHEPEHGHTEHQNGDHAVTICQPIK